MATPTPDPRALMERAIDVMNESRAEPRTDGKASPLVGAVLWRRDGTTETACRSELRDGDHAEFTLLERKHRSARLDEAVLFCTLEPCAPGARHHPKLSCAERIVLARIRQVWVGVEDPDPTVDRKGIKHLQDHGVTVHMFDRDLQERILEANRAFITQAHSRAQAAQARAGAPRAMLSPLEAALRSTTIRDLDRGAMADYRGAMSGRARTPEVHRRMVQQGLLRSRGEQLVPTGFGVLLFGKEPRTQLPQAGLLGTITYDDGSEELRDFDGPAIEVPEQAIAWLQAKLPHPISRTQAKRAARDATFYELLREGIVNALVHRDYAIAGAKCQLIATPGKVVVMSPGAPVEPITIEQLRTFEAPMLSRNPVLHFVFAKLDLAEERGLGLKSMRVKAAAAGLPVPAYTYDAPYVTLTLHRDAASAQTAVGRDLLARLTDAERAGWAWLVTREVITTADYQAALDVPNRTAKHHLRKLTELGLLRRTGAARATRYVVVRS